MSSCKNSINDWDRFALNGKVKTIIERIYEVEKKFGEWEIGDHVLGADSRISFDNLGNRRWIEYFDFDDYLTGKLIFKREDRDKIEEAFYDKNGKLVDFSRREILHNSKNELEYVIYDGVGEKISQGKSFYKKNRLVKDIHQTFENNEVKEETMDVREYDKYGNLVSRKIVDAKGKVISFSKYEYLDFDKKKNWTKKFVYFSEKDQEPCYVLIREYEYY